MEAPVGGETIRVGIRELRANLSALLCQAQEGATVLVTSRGEVVARLGPPPPPSLGPRCPGRLLGRIRMTDDFDELPDDVLVAMEDEPS